MPIYVYICEKCANREEHIQKFSDPPLRTCSKCQSESLSKQVTSAAFHLRGGGWYKDGYASNNTASAPATASETPAASASCGAACPTPAACSTPSASE